MESKRGSHKHSPLMQGNPGGCCPEYGIQYFDETGQEWEECPCCGQIGKVYVLGPECLMSVAEIAREAVDIFKKKLLIFRDVYGEKIS